MTQGNTKRAVLALAAALALAACGGGDTETAPGSTSESIVIDGSSTVYPLTEAAAEAFTTTQRGAARVTVGESGTGGGFRKFCRSETQIQNASRPILLDEMRACDEAGVRYVEVLIAFDGLSVVVHPSNPVTGVTKAELRRIWEPSAEGTITRWRQVNPAWPDQALQLFGPGTASGTFDYFTEAVMGDGGSSRTDFTPSEDDNVIVQGVAGNANALGYFGFAYYLQNRDRVRSLTVDGVAPTPETIADGSYPLSRPMFVYVNAEALRRPQVQRFMLYYVANAARLAPEVGYVPLPQSAYDTYAQRLRDIAVGTAFGGHNDVEASIAEAIARPLSTEIPAE
ncbi:MAG: PstS family phosphate ABC transporter substrate-binding protein [Hyphomonadaceae bacterium]|nr:PstS family phosphate ABC transporter substrate-binding protein [Hyphomonadaceae bacterium]